MCRHRREIIRPASGAEFSQTNRGTQTRFGKDYKRRDYWLLARKRIRRDLFYNRPVRELRPGCEPPSCILSELALCPRSPPCPSLSPKIRRWDKALPTQPWHGNN